MAIHEESTTRTIPAGEFKNRCLALMDEVNETGEEILITKRGRPVARLVRPSKPALPLLGCCRNIVRIVGDIMEPVSPIEEWEAYSDPDRVLDPTGYENS